MTKSWSASAEDTEDAKSWMPTPKKCVDPWIQGPMLHEVCSLEEYLPSGSYGKWPMYGWLLMIYRFTYEKWWFSIATLPLNTQRSCSSLNIFSHVLNSSKSDGGAFYPPLSRLDSAIRGNVGLNLEDVWKSVCLAKGSYSQEQALFNRRLGDWMSCKRSKCCDWLGLNISVCRAAIIGGIDSELKVPDNFIICYTY